MRIIREDSEDHTGDRITRPYFLQPIQFTPKCQNTLWHVHFRLSTTRYVKDRFTGSKVINHNFVPGVLLQ